MLIVQILKSGQVGAAGSLLECVGMDETAHYRESGLSLGRPKCCVQAGESFKTVAAKVLTAFTTGAIAKDCGLPKSTELGNRHQHYFSFDRYSYSRFYKNCKSLCIPRMSKDKM